MEHKKLNYRYTEQIDAWTITFVGEDKVLSYHCSEKHAARLVKCWNNHDALLDACKRDEMLANVAISAIPTGPYRDKLTEVNILRIKAIADCDVAK